jgi:hypothetical protein
MNGKPTDDDILAALYKVPRGGADATYVVKNRLRYRFIVDTPFVLRRLKRLEMKHKVERVDSNYVTMLCWRLTDATYAEIAEASELRRVIAQGARS